MLLAMYTFGSREHLDALVAAYEATVRGDIPRQEPDAARHEAGHAMATFINGGRVRRLTIVRTAEYRGRCTTVNFIDRHARRRNGAVAWAGAVAAGTLVGASNDLDRVVAIYGSVRSSMEAFEHAAWCVDQHQQHIGLLSEALRDRGTIEWQDMLSMFTPPAGAQYLTEESSPRGGGSEG